MDLAEENQATVAPSQSMGYSFNTMSLEVIEIPTEHRDLLNRLSELIPDLEPDSPQSLQRIFGLGLIALTMQITNKARAQDQAELVAELGDLAKSMVEAEGWSAL